MEFQSQISHFMFILQNRKCSRTWTAQTTLIVKARNQDPSKCSEKSLDNRFQRRMHSGRTRTGTGLGDRVLVGMALGVRP